MKLAMNINLPTIAKIICFLLFLLVGLWATTDILQSRKSFGERTIEAIAMVLVWTLMGILTIYFARFFLFLIGAFLVISLVVWFKDRMNK